MSATLGNLEKELDEGAFIRIHRSAIVRKDKVSAVLRGRFSTPVLELEDGCRLPVGRKYRQAVRSAFESRGSGEAAEDSKEEEKPVL